MAGETVKEQRTVVVVNESLMAMTLDAAKVAQASGDEVRFERLMDSFEFQLEQLTRIKTLPVEGESATGI